MAQDCPRDLGSMLAWASSPVRKLNRVPHPKSRSVRFRAGKLVVWRGHSCPRRLCFDVGAGVLARAQAQSGAYPKSRSVRFRGGEVGCVARTFLSAETLFRCWHRRRRPCVNSIGHGVVGCPVLNRVLCDLGRERWFSTVTLRLRLVSRGHSCPRELGQLRRSDIY